MLTRYTMTPEEVQEWMDARTKANPVIPACSAEKVAQMEEANTYPELIQTVQNSIRQTMLIGEAHHGAGEWKKQSQAFHLNRLAKHLADYILSGDIEDLHHLICRGGMALHQDPRPGSSR